MTSIWPVYLCQVPFLEVHRQRPLTQSLTLQQLLSTKWQPRIQTIHTNDKWSDLHNKGWNHYIHVYVLNRHLNFCIAISNNYYLLLFKFAKEITKKIKYTFIHVHLESDTSMFFIKWKSMNLFTSRLSTIIMW